MNYFKMVFKKRNYILAGLLVLMLSAFNNRVSVHLGRLDFEFILSKKLEKFLIYSKNDKGYNLKVIEVQPKQNSFFVKK